MYKYSPEEVKKIAVIGAGTMGPGIAQAFAMGGYIVDVWEPVEKNRKLARVRVRDGVATSVSMGDIALEEEAAVAGRVRFADSLKAAVEDAQLIVECIVEKVDAKISLYTELAALNKDAIIASNTSALNIFEVVPPELLDRQLIMHWYAPAQLVPLVEVVKSESAPQELADTVLAVLRKCGKEPVQMKKFIKGYIVNRLLQCINREVFFLLDNDYCTAEDIDFAARMSFIPRAMVLGLCKKIDFGGVDMTINNYRNHSYQMPPEVELPATLVRMEQAHEFGIKTGKGFYDYTGQDIEALLSKRDEQLCKSFALVRDFMKDPV